MQVGDLLFLASFLMLLVLLARSLWLVVRGNGLALRNTARFTAGFVVCYAAALLTSSLATPRRYFHPGQRRCFDDWCLAVNSIEPTAAPGAWTVTVRIESVAKRVRQRERGVALALEDQQGHRYLAGPALDRPVTDEVGPGESFTTTIPFRLPANTRPSGIVVRHSRFPTAFIIGDDSSLFHVPALHLVRVASPQTLEIVPASHPL